MRRALRVLLSVLGALVLLLALGFVAVFFSFGPGRDSGVRPLSPSALADGSYRGSGSAGAPFGAIAAFRKVEVELEVRDGRIESLRYLKPETEGPAAEVFAELSKRVLERQGPDIDAVSGGTWTSRALRKAVESALDRGGAKPR